MKARTWTLTYDEPDRHGRARVRSVNRVIDIADFKDRAGFAWLVIAANPHLSIRDIQAVLENVNEQHARSAGWISRHRWLFHGKGAPGAKQNADGQDRKARRIMRENPRLSSRQLAWLLRKNHVQRSPEWIRQNRAAD